MTRRVTSSTDRLFGLAMGYIGVVTFVLVFFLCARAGDLDPVGPRTGDVFASPLWVWLCATTVAAGAVMVMDPVRRAATASSRRAP